MVVAAALVHAASAFAGLVTACALSVACSTLAVASVGGRRRVWIGAAFAALAFAAHVALPVVLIPQNISLFDVPRTALARPLELLVAAPESALLVGIVLGDRTNVPSSLSLAFAATGTTHLLAISGFNMTLVATGVSLALRGRASPVVRAVVAIAAVVVYSLLVGLAASVLRAALMSAVATCGVVSGRRSATANALCAAVTAMLVADPSAITDLGLQLSALATAGLVLWQEPISDRLAAAPMVIREGIATTLAATLPTMPIVAGAFGRISLVSLVANLVCVPMFPLLMLSGAATAITGAIALDVARPVSLIAFGSTFALRTAVELFASIPLASLAVPAGPLTGLLAAAFELGVFLALRRADASASRRAVIAVLRRALDVVMRWRRPIVASPWRRHGPRARPRVPIARPSSTLLALAVLPAIVAATWPQASDTTRVIALDVGQGDAYLVESPAATMLIDGGPDPGRVIDELAATLGPWRHRIDVVALTHAHTDHGAGLLAVLERYEVGLAIEPVGLNPSPLTDLWSAAIAKASVPRRALSAGARLRVGDLTVDVLAPDDLPVDTPSLVMHVTRGAFSVLFTGDAVDDALARVLASGDALSSRVYVPPHHGAETPFAVALRTAARPDAALISVGAGNRYGHPTPSTLAALAGVPTYRTDQDGTVEIAQDGAGLVVRTHANALPAPRRGSVPYTPPRQ